MCLCRKCFIKDFYIESLNSPTTHSVEGGEGGGE